MINFSGQTALMFAAKRGNLAIIELLRSYETGVRTTRQLGFVPSGSTALMLA